MTRNGDVFARDLAQLQDRLPTFPRSLAVTQIEASLGRPVDVLFKTLGEPIAAASIAQVHPAEIEVDGVIRKVAVKVIRPGVRERFYAVSGERKLKNPAVRALTEAARLELEDSPA